MANSIQGRAYTSYFILALTFALAYFTPDPEKVTLGVIGFGAATAGTLFFKAWPSFYLSLTFFIMCLYFMFESAWLAALPVHALLFPVLASSLIIFRLQRPQLSWFKLGRIDLDSFYLMIAVSIGAAAALLFWANWADNLGYGEQVTKGFSQTPFWIAAIVGVPAFSLLMPLAEEFLYRGIMLGTLNQMTGSWWAALFIQSATYAAFHYARGFPNGKVGFIMVFTFGVALGLLRRRTGGLLAPYLVHMVADLIIGYFLIFKFL